MSELQGNLFLTMVRDSTGNLEFRASADVRSNTRSFAQGRPPATLVFSVIYVDEVVAYGPVFDFKNIDSEDHGLEQDLWEQTLRKLASVNLARDPYRDGEPLSEALWRTFMGDRTFTARPVPAAYAERSQV